MILVVAALCAGAPISRPDAENQLTLDLGVPIPLSVYGYRSKEGAKGLVWLGAVGLEYRRRVETDVGLELGMWVQAANVHGSDGDSSADVYFVSVGVLGAIEVSLGTPSLTFVLGLGALFNGIAVDDGIHVHTSALGGLGRARFSWPLSRHVAIGLSTSLELFSAPLDRETWFNTPLRETVVLGVTLGVTASWGDGARSGRR